MATTQKIVYWLGDSITFGSFDTGGMGFRGKFLMARPDFIATGNTTDVIVGPQSVASPVRNPWLGIDRSIHSGVNGSGIQYWITNVVTRVNACALVPTHMVIHIGINDINGPDSAATMLTNLGTLLDLINTNWPTMKVLVMQIANELLSGWDSVKYAAYNAGIPAVVSSRDSFCNLGTMPNNLTVHHFGDVQKVHPNAWGFNLMADAVIAGAAAAGW